MGGRAFRSDCVFWTVCLGTGMLTALGAPSAMAGLAPAARAGGPDTFWLDFTNIALGLATLGACLWVAWGIGQELVHRRRRRKVQLTTPRGLLILAALVLAPSRAGATVEMQNQAKKLGFPIKNCLDCHASPHSVDVMKKRAQDLKMAEGNCLACHGAKIPAALNHRGNWLVTEKDRRSAKEFDMAWLRDYKEPEPPRPAAAKAKADPGADHPKP